MLELNVWIVYDADGNYECHAAGPDEAADRYDNEIGGGAIRRCVKVVLNASPPVITELRGTVPDEVDTGATLTVS